MSHDRFVELVAELCAVRDEPDVEGILAGGCLAVQDFEVLLNNFQGDEQAIYLSFNFGVLSAGRSLQVFRLMLEANLSVYAQDQAQLGLDADTGCVQLIVRIPMVDGVDGGWLSETLEHYVEHGRYWKDTIVSATDEMFQGLCAGQFQWIRA